jgi:hypothetical protein
VRHFLDDGKTIRCAVELSDGRQCSLVMGHNGVHASRDPQPAPLNPFLKELYKVRDAIHGRLHKIESAAQHVPTPANGDALAALESRLHALENLEYRVRALESQPVQSPAPAELASRLDEVEKRSLAATDAAIEAVKRLAAAGTPLITPPSESEKGGENKNEN